MESAPQVALRWVTVLGGPLWQVDYARGSLEGEGIPTFVPDRESKVMDPAITGVDPLTFHLQVPSPLAEKARSLLDAQGLLAANGPRGPAKDAAAPSPEESLELLARRTRWAAMIVLTAPIAIASGFAYLKACRVHGMRARSHGLTVAAVVLAGVLLAVLGVALGTLAATGR